MRIESRDALVESVLRKARAEALAHRLPTGLILLAVVQFLFAALLSVSFVIALTTRRGASPQYLILAALVTLGSLLISGIGYLAQNRIFGYWGGNIMAIGWIAMIVAVTALHGFADFSDYSGSLFYPVLLILILNLHYRKRFR